MPPLPRPPPALPDELIEEILLRVPPNDPTSIVRATLVCKRWHCLVSDPGFRRRFLEFHHTLPVLGFIYCNAFANRFVPTYSFCLPYVDRLDGCVLDARHGRILLYCFVSFGRMDFFVSNPISGEIWRLPMPSPPTSCSWTAALLCASAGCDHLDCGCGPFLVVFVGTDMSDEFTSARVYSSETGAWSETTSVDQHPHAHGRVTRGRSALVGNAIYFLSDSIVRILRYDLGRHELSVITPPSACGASWPALMAAEDGGLGFAYVHEFKLYMWSRETGLEGWTQRKVIELKSLLPACALATSPNLIAVADCGGVIVTRTCSVGVFAVDIKSRHVTKLRDVVSFYGIVPYMSFYTPALRAAYVDEGPSSGEAT